MDTPTSCSLPSVSKVWLKMESVISFLHWVSLCRESVNYLPHILRSDKRRSRRRRRSSSSSSSSSRSSSSRRNCLAAWLKIGWPYQGIWAEKSVPQLHRSYTYNSSKIYARVFVKCSFRISTAVGCYMQISNRLLRMTQLQKREWKYYVEE